MLAYSTKGLTRVKYALSLMEFAPMCRFRLKKPIVLFTLSQMFLMCWSYFIDIVLILAQVGHSDRKFHLT